MTRLGVRIFRDAGLCTFGPCCAYCEWASEQRGLRGTFRPCLPPITLVRTENEIPKKFLSSFLIA